MPGTAAHPRAASAASARPQAPLRYRRIVAKFGTNLLTADTDRLDLEMMAALVGQVARLVRRGAEVIVVTSGAMAAGRHRLGRGSRSRRDLIYKQVLGSIGQTQLMQSWDSLFAWHDLVVGQTLITRRDIFDRLGYLNARNALLGLLEVGAVPIVNENDVIATDGFAEMRIGDNDNLSAYVANLTDAGLLAILTNIDGLYDKDPNLYPDAKLVPVVEHISAETEAMAGKAISERSRGGMVTKLQAAKLATASGVDVVIANGHTPDVLARLAAGESIGTLFPATVDHLESRRRWIRAAVAPKGRVVIDAGAARALTAGKSLLPAGIVGVYGGFGRADLIEIEGRDGRRLAVGLARYSAADVELIRGKRSDAIEALLGYSYGDAVVHRDDLVLD